MRALTLLGFALTFTMLVGGCGGSSPNGDAGDSSSVPSDGSATGPEIGGNGYTFRAPKGWARADVPAPVVVDALGLEPDSFVMEADPGKDAFRESIIVARIDPIDPDSIDELEGELLRGFEEEPGVSDVQAASRMLIYGSEAAVIQGRVSRDSAEYDFDMYAVIRDEATYAINFTFDKGMNNYERIGAANPVLSTWYWE